MLLINAPNYALLKISSWDIIIKNYFKPGLGSSTVDQVLKYTKYPKYIPSTSTGQVLIFLKVLKYIKYFHIKYKYSY